ncbi:MAG TPA: hypothetical protein VFI72_07955 [Candidatus Angelobacter sp.]|nr:hypothetical protein [Candidatus Angelobacter sp.]
MREVLLYDPERRSANWTDLLQEGQYAVFHSDVGTDVERTPEGRYLQPGENSTCLLFDSLPEAEEYCKAKVESIPRLRCDIYDHAGKSRPPLLTYVNRAHVRAPKKRVYWGWSLVAGSIISFWMEWYRGFAKGLYLIIGLNMLFAGLRLMYWGSGNAENRQSS